MPCASQADSASNVCMLNIMRAIISGGQPVRPEDLEAARAYSSIISSKIIAIIAIHHLGH